MYSRALAQAPGFMAFVTLALNRRKEKDVRKKVSTATMQRGKRTWYGRT